MAPPVNRATGVVSSSAYAAHRGVSPAYISKLKRLGKLAAPAVLPNGDINVVLADQMLGDAAAQPELPTSKGGPVYSEERAGREAAQRRLAELDLAEKQARTLSRADAENATFLLFRGLRDRMLALPQRLADDLAAEASPRMIEHRLRLAITEAFQASSAEMAARAAAATAAAEAPQDGQEAEDKEDDRKP
jgi:hypothetical protein